MRWKNIVGAWGAGLAVFCFRADGHSAVDIVRPGRVVKDGAELRSNSIRPEKSSIAFLSKNTEVFVLGTRHYQKSDLNNESDYLLVTTTVGVVGEVLAKNVVVAEKQDIFNDFFIKNISYNATLFPVAIEKARHLGVTQKKQLVLSMFYGENRSRGCQIAEGIELRDPMIFRHAARENCGTKTLEALSGSPTDVLKNITDVPDRWRIRVLRELDVPMTEKEPYLKEIILSGGGYSLDAADVLLDQLDGPHLDRKKNVTQFFAGCLGNPRVRVRQTAAKAFRDPRLDPAQAKKVLENARNDEDPVVRRHAQGSLERLNDPHPRPSLPIREDH